MVAALLTLSFLATSCGNSPVRTVSAKVPEAKLVCDTTMKRPALPPEYAIDWSRITNVDQARGAHLAFVQALRIREGAVAGYLVEIEGRLFACGSNMQFVRDFQRALP